MLPKITSPRAATQVSASARNQASPLPVAGFRDRMHNTQAPQHEAICPRWSWHVRCFDSASFLVVPDQVVLGFDPA